MNVRIIIYGLQNLISSSAVFHLVSVIINLVEVNTHGSSPTVPAAPWRVPCVISPAPAAAWLTASPAASAALLRSVNVRNKYEALENI